MAGLQKLVLIPGENYHIGKEEDCLSSKVNKITETVEKPGVSYHINTNDCLSSSVILFMDWFVYGIVLELICFV